MTGASVKLPRRSKGRRPSFFADPAIDQLMTFLLELMAETSGLADRVDTIERLLDAKASISRQDIESYVPDPAAEAERVARRQAFIERVLRLHQPA